MVVNEQGEDPDVREALEREDSVRKQLFDIQMRCNESLREINKQLKYCDDYPINGSVNQIRFRLQKQKEMITYILTGQCGGNRTA